MPHASCVPSELLVTQLPDPSRHPIPFALSLVAKKDCDYGLGTHYGQAAVISEKLEKEMLFEYNCYIGETTQIEGITTVKIISVV